MRKLIIAGALLSSGLAVANDGKDNGEREYISVLPTYEIPDSNRGTTRNGIGISLIYGHLYTHRLGVEANVKLSVFNTGKGNGSDFYQEGGTIDLTYTFNDRLGKAFLHPFVLGGVGGVYNDVVPDRLDKGSLIVNGGLGVVSKAFYHGVRLRLEGRYVRDFYRGDFEDYRASLGLEIPLGRTVERTIEIPPERVEIREVIKEVPRPFVDSDGDTVADELDKCPDTPKGLRVDAEGCVIPDQVIELRGVTFEFDKARLTPNAETVLDTVVKAFIGQPSLKVEIGGHTDSKGSDAYNLKLSQRRADAVRAYLISKGAKSEQIIAKGYGESQLLIKPETSEDDRELNRRVEFKVVGP